MSADRFTPRAPLQRGQLILAAIAGLVVLSVLAASASIIYASTHDGLPRTTSLLTRSNLTAPAAAALSLPAEALSPLNRLSMSPQEALRQNQAIPVARLPNPPARPFNLVGPLADFDSAVDCLAAAVYYEARNETIDGRRAIAQVVINRLRHPQYPKTVCEVVFQGAERANGCQFTFACDGALATPPAAAAFTRARAIAEQALRGLVYAPVGGATHYHAAYVVPYWGESLVKVQTIGLHIFYRWPGAAGLPTAFTGRHRDGEAIPMALSAVLLASQLRRAETAPLPLPDAPALISDNKAIVAPTATIPTRDASPTFAFPSSAANDLQRAPHPAPAAPPVDTSAPPSVNRRLPFSRPF